MAILLLRALIDSWQLLTCHLKGRDGTLERKSGKDEKKEAAALAECAPISVHHNGECQ